MNLKQSLRQYVTIKKVFDHQKNLYKYIFSCKTEICALGQKIVDLCFFKIFF